MRRHNDTSAAILSSWKAGFPAADIEQVRAIWLADLGYQFEKLRSRDAEEMDALAIRAVPSGARNPTDIGFAFSIFIQGFLRGQKTEEPTDYELLMAGAQFLGISEPNADVLFLEIYQFISELFSAPNVLKVLTKVPAEALTHGHENWTKIIRSLAQKCDNPTIALLGFSALATAPLLFLIICAASRHSAGIDATISLVAKAIENQLDDPPVGFLESEGNLDFQVIWRGVSAAEFLHGMKEVLNESQPKLPLG